MAKGEKQIKTYPLVKKIEETNSAIVNKVKSTKGRYYIMKKARQNTKEYNDLIIREFQILKRFSHPNIVEVTDIDTDTDGRTFFLQPFLSGKPINRYFKSFSPDLIDALIQTTHALAALHNKGFIHGDIKPEHLLYNKKTKNIMLIDFGYARVPDDITIRTGTMGYIAPEVLKGTGLDQRSDIYSLGVIAYELLTGKSAAHQWQDITAIPEEVNNIFRRMCAHEPALRPSVLEIYAVLSSYTPAKQVMPTYQVNLPPPTFVERKKIIDTLVLARGKAYTITGDAGVGKTRLLLELKYLHIQKGHSVLYHLGGERNTLLEILCRFLDLEIEPTIHGHDKYAVFHTIFHRLKEKAFSVPVILLIDELEVMHDHDHTLLRYLGFGLKETNIHVVCATNNSDSIQKLGFQSLNLDPLTFEGTQKLVSSTFYRLGLDDKEKGTIQAFSQWLHKHSGGNPFYIVELLKTLFDQKILRYMNHGWQIDIIGLKRSNFPKRLEKLILQRIEHLDTSATTILHALALIDTPIEPEVLNKAFADVTHVSIERLKNLGFVREDVVRNTRVVFIPNQIIRHLVHLKILKRRQAILYKQIISVLEQEKSTDAYIPLLAILTDRIRDKTRAIKYAQQAASRAKKIYDHESAVNFYRIVLKNTSAQSRKYNTIVLKIAELLITAGKCQEALDLYQEITARAPEDLKPVIIADIGRAYYHMGHYDEAIDHLQKAYKILVNRDKTRAHEIQTRLAYCLTVTHRFTEAQSHIRQPLEYARTNKDNTLFSTALYNKAVFEQQQGNQEQSIKCAETHVEFCRKHGFWRDEAFSALLLSRIYYNRHDLTSAQKYTDTAIASLKKSCDTVAMLSALENKALMLFDQGHVDQSQTALQSTLTSGEQIHHVPTIITCLSALGMINVLKGKFDTALTNIQQGLKYQPEKGSLLSDLATIYILKNNINKAKLVQKRFIETSKDLYYYRTAMRIALAENDHEAIREHIKTIESISDLTQLNHNQKINIWQDIMIALYHVGDYQLSHQYAQKIIKQTLANDIRHVIAQAYAKLVKYHLDKTGLDLTEEVDTLRQASLVHMMTVLQRLRIEALMLYQPTQESAWAMSQELLNCLELAQSINAKQETARLLKLQHTLFPVILNSDSIPTVSTRYLNVFSRIALMIERHLGDADFLENLLDIVIQTTEAERGALFLYTADNIEFITGRNIDQTTLADAADLSKTAISNLYKNEIVFSQNALSDPDFNEKKSVVLNKIRALLCIPLTIDDNVVGALYLDSRFQGRTFSQQDKDFLTAVARILAAVIDKSLTVQQIIEENRNLHRAIITDIGQGYLISKSKPMKHVYHLIDQVAKTNAPVLLVGETGTGKGMIARLIHQKSARSNSNFTVINCGTIPETLLESELFGHKKGAFTGAIADKAGLLEQAHGGTIFLDEITNTSPAFQAKLLEAIEDKLIRRVGETKIHTIDVRFIFATNKDLEIEVEDGRFRKDLYYRINVFKINIPPLRDRASDIKLLAQFFMEKSSKDVGKDIIGLTPEAMKILHTYHWAGNVRELRHVIERAVVLARGMNITSHELNLGAGSSSETGTLREVKKDAIIEALEATNYNISQAAKLLRISRRTIQRYRKKFNF